MSMLKSSAPHKSAHLIWVVPKWILPARDGSRYATTSLIRELCKVGYVIDLVALVPESEQVDHERACNELGVRSVSLIRRRARRLNPFTIVRGLVSHRGVPVTMWPYAERKVRRELSEAIAKLADAQSTLVYEGLHSSLVNEDIRPALVKSIVYRAQNRESDIWAKKSKKATWWQRPFFRWQGRLVSQIENSLASNCDCVAAISCEDRDSFFRADPSLNQKVRIVPVGFDFSSPLPIASETPIRLLFVGRLDWPPNYEGLGWFLEQVWPVVRSQRTDVELTIVGSGRLPKAIGALTSQEGVRFMGEVDSLEDFYAESHFSIVPVQYGAGTRVKVIEAARFGRACISTTQGVEGTGLGTNEYIAANSAEQWISAMSALNRELAQDLGRRAFGTLKEQYSLSVARNSFIAALGSYNEIVAFREGEQLCAAL